MKLEHQIRAFEQLLAQYDGTIPLHRFLVTYFKKNKQMGSSDRRWASRYVYSFFRLGKALKKEEQTRRLAVADFLCNTTASLVIEKYLPQLLEQINLPVSAKITLVTDVYPDFKLTDVFPFSAHLSPEIDQEAFLNAFFIQPDLFIRVQEKHAATVLKTLKNAEVPVETLLR